MRLSAFTKEVLKCRRFAREKKRMGYERVEGPWQIAHGARTHEVITDVVIDPNGKSVWVKTGERP